jgi:multisubunit Na+/H+ antiporter MnhG subunit
MVNSIKSLILNPSPNNIVDEIIEGLENWCLVFNDYFLIFCKYLKYIFVFIVLFIGVLTLLRLRGVYRQSRLMGTEKKDDSFTKIRLVLGLSYIFLAFGILFNYLTYFVIWLLEPLPDKLIYNFIDFNGINPFDLNGIKDISLSQYPHEKTIYYCFAFGSLISFLDILLSLWYLINSNRLIHNPNKALRALICGIFGCILFGFTTYLPFFL